MKRHPGSGLCLLGYVLLAALSNNSARCQDAASPSWNAKAAANYLDERTEWWLKWRGAARGQGTACASCHTSLPLALARSALGEPLGETASGAIESRLVDNMKKRVENWEQIVSGSTSKKDPFVAYYADKEEESLATESVMNALILVNHDTRREQGALSATTKKALSHLWEQQQENGSWPWLDFGLNPWEKDGAYYGACLAAVGVGSAGKNYYSQAEIQTKLAALRNYLKTESARQPLHHRVLSLWASTELPGILTPQEQQQLIAELRGAQESDGGWSLMKLGTKGHGNGEWKSQGVYPAGLISDGYATGLVVMALERAGVEADDPNLRKAVSWLISHQKEGTWPANYLNKKRDPQDNIGKFMRDAATSFAILGLTEPSRPGLVNIQQDHAAPGPVRAVAARPVRIRP